MNSHPLPLYESLPKDKKKIWIDQGLAENKYFLYQ